MCLRLIFALSVLACVPLAEATVVLAQEASAQGNSDAYIPGAQLTELERSALAGSAEAALKIANSHLISNGPSDEGLYWMSIAAENGSKDALFKMGAWLELRNGDKYRIRARYWLERATKEGKADDAKRAADLLKEMDLEDKK